MIRFSNLLIPGRMARRLVSFALAAAILKLAAHAGSSKHIEISGIYPHLAMFNEEAECGTGAVVPWSDRLWVLTYAPHKPEGSTDKLYEINSDLERVIRKESIGGTPANRMIHPESQQLFMGPYAIDSSRNVRVIPYSIMFGRPTGLARHLVDPANQIVYATMEEGFYEVDVKTLSVKELWADEQRKQGRKANLPGYHGKGFYSAQGRYVYANNGDHAPEARKDPTVPSGVLAEWDGTASSWNIVRRNQFTEVSGPGDIKGNSPGDDRLWSIGWDNRSLILMLLENRQWHSFRLPKASHCYDGAHGWNTEWPRIRDIGEKSLLMTMHGEFWRFPKAFSIANSSGIAPRSTYLKVIGDFCRWDGRLVFGCDDTAQSEFLNNHPLKGKLAAPGKSQSNLWFVEPTRLDSFGPALGRGAVWLNDTVQHGVPSEPFLFAGFENRSLHLRNGGSEPVSVTLEVDKQGNGEWTSFRRMSVAAGANAWVAFSPRDKGQWIRLAADRDAKEMTAFFHYRGEDKRTKDDARLSAGLARPDSAEVTGGLLHARGGDAKTLRLALKDSSGHAVAYDLDSNLKLARTNDTAGAEWVMKNVSINAPLLTSDAASVLYVDGQGKRWRLPKGDAALEVQGPLGFDRLCREVCTERNLLNAHGTFYEMPAENAGGFIRLRPITTHNLRIHDFASYRGLLVMTGVSKAGSGTRIIQSDDGQCAVWVGAVDDLWAFGKPRGRGGPWMNSTIKGGVPSDAYLATGYDRKRLSISHSGSQTVSFKVEADFTGDGQWSEYIVLTVGPGKERDYVFPDAFGAYWLRLTASSDVEATAQFTYD